MKKSLFKILFTFILLQAYSANAIKSITVTGSTTVKSILNYYESIIEKQSGVQVNFIAKNPKQSMIDLINGDTDIAVISTPLSYLSSLYKELSDIDVTSFRSYPLGKSSIVFITHPTNPVKNITMDKIKSILLGKITNWQELGGKDETIMIVTEFSGEGVRTEIEQSFLKSEISIPVKIMENASGIKEIVASVPNALGITSASLTDNTVRILTTDYTLSQPIIFIAKPSSDDRITNFVNALKVIEPHDIY